jgi:NTP pyrophosphatase (non-canonical NTP hydrolase)
MAMHMNGLTKLVEELGELQQITAKKMAYFDTDEHPDGKGSMKLRLEEEMADVLAAIMFVQCVNGLDGDFINERYQKKFNRFMDWHINSEIVLQDRKHPSHTTRSSDASTFDEICTKCGAHDIVGGGWGKLAEPCPSVA